MDKTEASLRLLDIIAAIFISFVVIGVTGELIVHVLESRKNKQLMALHDLESDRLRLEIAEANRRAAEANLRLADIYDRIQWRHIAPDKMDSIVSALQGLGKNGLATKGVFFSVPDPEAESLANEIVLAREKAYNRIMHNRASFSPTLRIEHAPKPPARVVIPVGICFLTDAGNLGDESIRRCVSAFNDAGLCSTAEQAMEGVKYSEVFIEVGYNPNISREIQIIQETTPTTQPQ